MKMSIEKIANLKFTRKVALVLVAFYLVMGAGLYAVSLKFVSDRMDSKIQIDMKQTLRDVAAKINTELEKSAITIRNLSTTSSIVRPLQIYGIDYQLREFCEKDIVNNPDYNIRNLILTDEEKKVVYNNTPFTLDSIQYSLKPSNYIQCIEKDTLYFQIYYPIFKENEEHKADKKSVPARNYKDLIGSIATIYSLLDFKEPITEGLEGTPFIIFPIIKNKANFSFLTFTSHTSDINKDIKYTFYSGVTKSQEEIVSSNIIDSLDMFNGTGIGISIHADEYQRILSKGYLYSVYWAMALLAVLSILLFLMKLFFNSRYKMEAEIQQLRMEKHDFIKHVNIVNTLAATSELEVLKEYISSLGETIAVESALEKIDNWAVYVLLRQKEKLAYERGIKFELIVKTSLEDLKVKTHELCTVVGNLVDNAIEASENVSADKRYIEIEVSKMQNSFVFRVLNKGMEITEKNLDKIFSYGYTTKKEKEGHGMGLYIVSKIINKYNGSIKVDNRNGMVEFSVYFPE